jgi:transcription initiation factor TFIID TATA-box-binding protein
MTDIYDVELVNIIATLDFNRELELSAVADLLESCDKVSKVNYAPEKNHWLQTQFKLDGITKYVAFYRSGSSSLVGCNSFKQLDELEKQVRTAMEPVIRDPPTLKIKNLVCVSKLDQKFDLSHLAIAAGLEQVEYEPEQFPGLIYRGDKSDAVLLVFASGKVVITGATTEKAANQSIQVFVKKLEDWGFRGN